MTKRSVRVRRDEKIIGIFPPEQLPSLLDTGSLTGEEECWSEEMPEWTPLHEFLRKTRVPTYSRSGRSTGSTTGRSSAGRGSRSQQNLPAILSGWVAFLVALAFLVGAGFWVSSLSKEIGRLKDRIDELGKKLAEKESENRRLLFSTNEVAERGTVKGRIALRDDSGRRNSVPGAQVFLFRRKAIEGYLETRTREAEAIPADQRPDMNAFFSIGLPMPVATTTTDASGRFDFSVPETDEYVVHVGLNLAEHGGTGTRIWFVAFDSSDPANAPIEVNDANSVRQFIPSLMIVQGR